MNYTARKMATTRLMYKGRMVEVQDFEKKTYESGITEFVCYYKGIRLFGETIPLLRSKLEGILDKEK